MRVEQNKNSIVRVQNLTLAYDDYVVLNDVSFEVERGKCLFVMGGSGCGKSTLLKSMVGLLEPINGDVIINKSNLWTDSSRTNQVLQEFGVLFQGGALWSSMTIQENVALPLEIYTDLKEEDIRDIVGYKLSLVGLSGFESFWPITSKCCYVSSFFRGTNHTSFCSVFLHQIRFPYHFDDH